MPWWGIALIVIGALVVAWLFVTAVFALALGAICGQVVSGIEVAKQKGKSS